MEYGVNVSNKFAFLSGDEDVQDPDDLIARAEQQAKKEKASALKKDTKKSVVEKKVTISTTINSVSNKENVDHRRPPRRDSGGPRSGPVGGKGPRTGGYRRSDENGEGDDVSSGEARVRNFNNRPFPRDGQQHREGGGRFNNSGERGHNNGERNHNNGERNHNNGERNHNNGERNHNSGERGLPRRFNNPRSPRSNNVGDNLADDSHGEGGNRNNRFRRNGPPRGDRISGSDKTGIRSVPKKDGFGRGNWGTENDELVGEVEHANIDVSINLTVDPVENGDVQVESEKPEDVEPELEPPRELTLEEWKAQNKSEAPKFNVRKPGEGADKKIYQKLVPIKRPDDKAKSEPEEEEEVQVKQPREKALNIEVSFHDPQRNRGRGFRDDRRGDAIREDHRGSGETRGSGENRVSGSSINNTNNIRGNVGRRGGGSGGGVGGGRNHPATHFNFTAESFPALGSH